MNEKFLTMNEIERLMASSLDGAQMKRLHVVLSHCLIDESDFPSVFGKHSSNQGLLEAFLGAKRLEGCSERSLRYYSSTLKKFIESVGKPLSHVSTDDVREYLANYQALGNLSNVTADTCAASSQACSHGLKSGSDPQKPHAAYQENPHPQGHQAGYLRRVLGIAARQLHDIAGFGDDRHAVFDRRARGRIGEAQPGRHRFRRPRMRCARQRRQRAKTCTSSRAQKCISKRISIKGRTRMRRFSHRSTRHSTALRSAASKHG